MIAAPEAVPPRPVDSSRRILFLCHRRLSTFMARDWEIIRLAWPQSQLVVMRGARDLGRIASEVVRADLVFCWFGAAHAVWAALCNRGAKPLVVVAGGWDVARLPEINYGVYATFPQAPISRWLFRRADRVLAVSQFNARSIEENARVLPERIGLIQHGFDPDAWPLGTAPRSLDVLTLAGDHVRVKGLDLLIKAAELMPGVRFQVAGTLNPSDRREFEAGKTANLEFVGRLEGAALRERMQSARVYLQPSRHESFGCAVAEAMLCGCVPVVSRAGALPEVVGEAGYYMDMLTPEHIVLALQPALRAPEEARDRARQRIVDTFGLESYALRLRDELARLLR